MNLLIFFAEINSVRGQIMNTVGFEKRIVLNISTLFLIVRVFYYRSRTDFFVRRTNLMLTVEFNYEVWVAWLIWIDAILGCKSCYHWIWNVKHEDLIDTIQRKIYKDLLSSNFIHRLHHTQIWRTPSTCFRSNYLSTTFWSQLTSIFLKLLGTSWEKWNEGEN